MGLVDKAKELLGDHADEAKGAVDAAADKAKELAPDQVDGIVDQAADKAKDVIDGACGPPMEVPEPASSRGCGLRRVRGGIMPACPPLERDGVRWRSSSVIGPAW
jgi:hypothetical protein